MRLLGQKPLGAPAPAKSASAGPFGRLEDPQHVSSDVAPADRRDPPRDPREDEAKWVKYAKDRWRDSLRSARRSEMESRVLESTAMCLGDRGQWYLWDSDRDAFDDLRYADEAYRYVTDDQVSPILDKIAALATASKPDGAPVGSTVAPVDQAAAAEGRGVLSWWEDDFDLPAFLLAAVNQVVRTTTVWAHCAWHPTKAAPLPVTDPQTGEIRRVVTAPIGGPQVDLLSWYQVFPYSDVTDASKMRGAVIARLMTVNEAMEYYGDRAKDVRPDAPGQDLAYFQSRYAYLAGQLNFQANSADGGRENKTHVTVYELLETASPRYPKGLRVVVAGDRCLFTGDLPGAKKDALPLIPLTFRRRDGTPWGGNVVSPLASLQRAINRNWSAVLDVVENQQVYLAVEDGTELSPDAYRHAPPARERRRIERIYHRQGSAPPQFQLPPDPSAAMLQVNEVLLDRMKAISGVRDALQGAAPASDSGVKIHLLQEAAKSQLSLFTQAIESFVRELSEAVIRLYAENARTTVLMGLSDSGDPQERRVGASALRALASGGQVRVRITPGSAMPKFPEAADEQIQKMLTEAMACQTPGHLKLLIAGLKAMSWEGSNKVAEDFTAALEQFAADMERQNPPAPPPPDPAQVQELRNQQLQTQQEAEHAHAVDLAEIDLHKQMALIDARAHADAQKALVERAHPSVSLSGKLDPQGTVDAEKAAGLGGDLQSAKQMAVPPKPAPGKPTGDKRP